MEKELVLKTMREAGKPIAAGVHLHLTGDTISPVFLSSANTLSTTFLSSPDNVATSPAAIGFPASLIVLSTSSFSISVLFLFSFPDAKVKTFF